MSEFVFQDVHVVAKYIHSFSPESSPIKLHKSLYFLFGYYGAMPKEEKEGVSEGTKCTIPYLFDADFEAWSYGAVQRDVYLESKRDDYFNYQSVMKAVKEVGSHPEVKEFIDGLLVQIFSVSDFGLVDRARQDESYQQAYEKGKASVISREALLKEYREKYV